MSIYEIPVTTISGEQTSLEPYRGHVMLIVNVASKCGFTPQYKGLEAMYREFQDQGFVVLGFPCNQFANQEPGTEEQIREFCSSSFEVTFPLFSKIKVNGPDSHPLYKHLKTSKSGTFGSGMIKWNFTKFLIARDGTVVARFGPFSSPERIRKELAIQLSKPVEDPARS